jgi:uncharacterized membrane protein YhaH (DUF805 family)
VKLKNLRIGKLNIKIMNWYLKVLKQYADFNSRARRKEYWMFILFNAIFGGIAMLLDNALGFAWGGVAYAIDQGDVILTPGPLYGIYALVLFIPGLAVLVRRLHDIGKSGWMVLIALIPVIGAIWLLVLLLTDSNPGENLYGANPKEVTL